jgi:hypothetical protein
MVMRCLRCGALAPLRAGDDALGGARVLGGRGETAARGVVYLVFGAPLLLSFLGFVPAVMSRQWTRAVIALSTLVFCCAPMALARYRTRAQGFFAGFVVVMVGALIGGLIGWRIDTALFGLPEGNMLLPGVAAGGFVGFMVDVTT